MNETPSTDAMPASDAPRGTGLLASVLGVWVAPPWARWTGAKLGAAAQRTSRAVKARPRTSAGALAGVLLLAVAGWYGMAWWQARPKPV